MHWLDFLIGCCACSVFGIIFCSVQDIMGKRDIRSVQKETEQLKSMRNDEGREG
ncbi:hypothetical protein SAMN04487919_16111 [Bacillus sp. ok061]|uniref:hypothetical protein n=1 Tax=Bacillus sp. ok061 TaxID=1761766 RepID=UPI00089E5A59|nr:hypothetical protein [Bacillus sp. ok061]SEG88371.1 hypothetical protein SAMN04487919_16111 [Bacillus sp. ok061]